MSNEAVQVVVRCRPMSRKEEQSECVPIIKTYPTRGVIEVQNPKARSENEKTKLFTFDAVYDWK